MDIAELNKILASHYLCEEKTIVPAMNTPSNTIPNTKDVSPVTTSTIETTIICTTRDTKSRESFACVASNIFLLKLYFLSNKVISNCVVVELVINRIINILILFKLSHP